MNPPLPGRAGRTSAAAMRERWFAGVPVLRTLSDIADANVAAPGEYPALYFEGSLHGNRELIAGARRLAGALQRLGIERGERILVNLPNCPEIISCYLASTFLGAVIVPTAPGLTVEELCYIIADCAPAAIVMTRDKAEQLRREIAKASGIKAIIAGGKGEPELSALIGNSAPLEQAAAVEPEDLAAIIYTSGTTGKPKGVMLSHSGLSRQACLNHGFYVGPGEDPSAATLLMPLPLCHVFGLAVTLAALLMRNLVVLMERFDPDQALVLIREQRVRVVPAVPTMLVRLLAAEGADAATGSVRQWDCGGSPLAAEVLDQIERKLGGLVTEGWGLSETSSAVAQNVIGVPRKAGSVGLALPGLEVQVRSQGDAPCGPGEPGELVVRGETLMQGYWRRPEATAAAMTADGFFKTGDIGRIDADGYVFIMGRRDDLIIRGGMNISPRELEEAILELAGVREVAVVGLPDRELGQIAGAFVVPAEDGSVTEAEILAYCRRRLARHKLPGRVVILDRLPYNSTGKVVKAELRRRYAG